MRCKKCGSELKEHHKYCISCGELNPGSVFSQPASSASSPNKTASQKVSAEASAASSSQEQEQAAPADNQTAPESEKDKNVLLKKPIVVEAGNIAVTLSEEGIVWKKNPDTKNQVSLKMGDKGVSISKDGVRVSPSAGAEPREQPPVSHTRYAPQPPKPQSTVNPSSPSDSSPVVRMPPPIRVRNIKPKSKYKEVHKNPNSGIWVYLVGVIAAALVLFPLNLSNLFFVLIGVGALALGVYQLASGKYLEMSSGKLAFTYGLCSLAVFMVCAVLG